MIGPHGESDEEWDKENFPTAPKIVAGSAKAKPD